jgi:hypothetical protein
LKFSDDAVHASRFDGHATLRWRILDEDGEVVDTACFNASADA